MIRRMPRATLVLASMALSIVAAQQPAHANDVFCKPNIKVNNNKSIAIKVLRLEYTVNGKAETEGLANKVLARNTSGTDDEYTWKSQKLQHAGEGVAIPSTRIEYKEDNSGSGDGFGPAKWSKSHAHSGTCQDSDTYSHTID